MIVSKIYGGLAGQMLQYSLGRALSIKHNTQLYLDITWFGIDVAAQGSTPRDFGLSKFNTNFRLYKPLSLISAVKRKLRMAPSLRLIKEPHFSYDPSVSDAPDNIILDGYWFSYNYFDHIRDTLKKDFTPKFINTPNNNLIRSIASSENPVALHIRRGDYVTNANANKFHGVMGMDYYNEAIAQLNKRVNNPSYFIFSDDFTWVKQNFEFLSNKTYVDFNGDANNHMDIFLMSQCKHNIVANSGFSWWGAYLNKHPKKVVITPQAWFQDKKYSSKDVKLNDWTSL